MNFNPRSAVQYFKRYLTKFLPKEAQGWGQVIRFYGLPGIVVLAIAIALAIHISFLPPSTVYLATGQDGTSYKGISEKFEKNFREKGIRLELVATSGLGEGLLDLNSEKSNISASFLTAGVETAKDYPNLVSLGSIQYAPIWIFYKGEPIDTNDPFEYFSDKKISIGSPGNITNKIFKKLYELNQKTLPATNNFIEVSYKEAADQFIAGNLDAVFIVDSVQSETVRRILATPGVQIMNFPLADAYLKKMPALQKLVIPKGSIRLDSVYPPKDITILASTTTLLVEKDMHPAVQWAYLISAKEVGNLNNTFFDTPGYFPKDMDDSFPLSPVAKRFYAQGTPVIFSYLPFWLASIIEDVWAYLLAFFFLIYPAYKLLYSIRMYPAELLMNKMFVNLRELDEAIVQAQSEQDLQIIFEAIRIYERDIYQNWLFEKNSRFYFNLKNALASVKRDAESKLGQIKNA